LQHAVADQERLVQTLVRTRIRVAISLMQIEPGADDRNEELVVRLTSPALCCVHIEHSGGALLDWGADIAANEASRY